MSGRLGVTCMGGGRCTGSFASTTAGIGASSGVEDGGGDSCNCREAVLEMRF